MAPKNASEAFVAHIAQHSFLSLWSYANPQGKHGKELCDVLVVCDPDVIILSVKEATPTESGDIAVDWARWHRSVIDASTRQLYGAERWLKLAPHVIRSDGAVGLALPEVTRRRTHRVAVALGGGGSIPIPTGDFGKGFVHVLTEGSLNVILGELDTIRDFTAYFTAKETLLTSGGRLDLEGDETDLLAFYLFNGRKLPDPSLHTIVGAGSWDQFRTGPEYLAKQKVDVVSYRWDWLIERFGADILRDNMEFGSTLNDNELVLRDMAREDRFARRVLGGAFAEFFELARENKVRSRAVRSPSGIVYVFLARPHGYPRKDRVAELAARCFIARGVHADAVTVIGIATEQYEKGKGYSLDAVRIHIPAWTADHQAAMESAQREFGYFVKPERTHTSEDEFPIM